MTLPLGTVAIVRFGSDAWGGGAIGVALIRAYRGDQALVAKTRGRNGGLGHWAKARWVPVESIAREATDRERVMGMPIDKVPPAVAE